MKRRVFQGSATWLSLLYGSLIAGAATDPFLQLSSPIFTNGQVQFTLTGESGVRYVIEASTNAQSWTPVVTNSDFSMTRLITLPASNNPEFYRAWRYPLPRFPGAITARQNIDFRGNSAHFDSFDSADPAKSTNGEYDPTKPQHNGDIASELGLTYVGTANINGKLRIGTNGSYSLGTNGYVGPIGWYGPGAYSPDWVRNDFRFALPSVARPYSSGSSIPPGSGTNYTILTPGNYYVSGDFRPTGAAKTILIVGGLAQLYVTGDFVMPSSWEINITPGSDFRLFVGTSNGPATQGAFGRVQTAVGGGVPAFQYYGLPSNVSLIWNGNDTYKGTIYAPQATVILGGGGASTYDYQGAIVADSFQLNGHFYFHYDQNLFKKGPQR